MVETVAVPASIEKSVIFLSKRATEVENKRINMKNKEYSPLLISSEHLKNKEKPQNRALEQGSYTECDVEKSCAVTKHQEASERIFDEKNGYATFNLSYGTIKCLGLLPYLATASSLKRIHFVEYGSFFLRLLLYL